jgi:D-alanine-D-alanine ligase
MSQLQTKDYGRVAVLMGGWSAEREISLLSGNAVLRALQQQSVDAHGVDVDHEVAAKLRQLQAQRAFVVLHGRGGEDGVIQGLLEAMDIPYTGSGVLGSAISIDKLRSKQIWTAQGLPTPDYVVLDGEQSCQQAVAQLGLPLIIKPVMEGSSIGMSKVESAEDMLSAWQCARDCGGVVIAEKWIDGEEYTAAVIGKTVLPMIKLKTPHAFYDYDAKYEADDTQYICPCGLDEKTEAELAELSLQAFELLSATGWGRVDFMLDAAGKPWLIEVNTVPGMTDHSLVPMAAKQAGMDFEQLVLAILETSMETSMETADV